jgi:excisionase family DNA binding protein
VITVLRVKVRAEVPGDPPQEVLIDPLLLTIDETAQVLRLSRRFVYVLVMTGQIRSIKLGRSRRVPLKWLHEYVDSLLQAS